MLPRGHATQSGHTEPSVSQLSAPSAPPYLYDARIAYVSPYSLRTGRLDGAAGGIGRRYNADVARVERIVCILDFARLRPPPHT